MADILHHENYVNKVVAVQNSPDRKLPAPSTPLKREKIMHAKTHQAWIIHPM